MNGANALEDVNVQLAAGPTTELHLQRLTLLDDVFTQAIPAVESLDWLREHDPAALDAGRDILRDAITQRLRSLPELSRLQEKRAENTPFRRYRGRENESRFRGGSARRLDAPEDNDRDENGTSEAPAAEDPLHLVEQVEPLADYFPLIHLSYGLLLMHRASERRRTGRSPLDVLEGVLSDAEQRAGGRNARKPTPAERDEAELQRRAHRHVERAVSLMDDDDPLWLVALETLGQLAEKVDDPVGAYRAYQAVDAAQGGYAEKLDALGATIRERARERLLAYIDGLLAAGDLDGAAALLAQANPPEDDTAFQVQAADLALLRGDLDTAAAVYDDVIGRER